MKSKIFIAAGLLVPATGYSQTTTYYATSPGTAGQVADRGFHIGDGSGAASNATTQFNTFVGIYSGHFTAGNEEDEADSNTFVGYQSGYENTTGHDNVFLGFKSGFNNLTSANNVFIGVSAGQNNSNNLNTYIGHLSGINTAGGQNTFLGARSGENVVGSKNVVLGYCAAKDGVLGEGNVIIGSQAGMSLSGSNKLFIENTAKSNPLIYGEFDNDVVKLNAQKVGIGYESLGSSEYGFGGFPTATTPDLSDYRIFVKGGVLAEEVRVRTDLWPDYVFENDYELLPLSEVEQYIIENKHLPNMPSAAEVEEDGLALGNIVKLQQEKIEELTLHLIEQQKEMEAMKAQLQELIKKN